MNKTITHDNLIIAKISLITTLLLWSSGFIAIRIGLSGYHPGSLALLHYLLSTVCMLIPFFFSKSRTIPNFIDLIVFFLIGSIGFGIYNIALNYGETTIDLSITSFINSQIPMTAILLAILFLKEKIRIVGWIGMVISFIGVFIIYQGLCLDAHWSLGIIYLLIANLCAAIYTLSCKFLLRRYSPIELLTYTIASGTLFLLIYLPSLCKELIIAPFPATLAGIYLGILPGAFGYLTWNVALKSFTVSKASAYLYSMPIITTLMAWGLLREVPSLTSIVGGMIALIGAIIVSSFTN